MKSFLSARRMPNPPPSSPSRGTWIEMLMAAVAAAARCPVVPLTGDVD